MSVNKAILLGRLGQDPEIRETKNGKKVANLSLATTERVKNGENKTAWHKVQFWNKTAEVCEKYLKKGMMVFIEGKITYRSYEDKDGNTKYITEIVGYNLEMISSESNASKQKQAKQAEVDPDSPFGGEDDDLPF